MKYQVDGITETPEGLQTSRHTLTVSDKLEDVLEDLVEFRAGQIKGFTALVVTVRK